MGPDGFSVSAADDAGTCFFLRRLGPKEKHRFHHHVQLRNHRVGGDSVGALGLQPGFWPRPGGVEIHRRPAMVRTERCFRKRSWSLLRYHPTSSIHDLPGHVCHHHPGAGDRRLRREDEVQRAMHLHRAVGDHRIRADRPLGLGRRLAG